MVSEALAALVIRDAEEAIAKNLRRSGLPHSYRSGERALGHLPMSAGDAISACQMLGTEIRGAFLSGPAGAFKTSVAASFLASQIRAGGVGRYIAVPDLLTDLYAIYASDDSRSRADIVDALVTTPMLVLDDLGKEKATEHATGVIFEVLDGRYRDARKGRWTIITSQYVPDTLCKRFPEQETADAIARRIAEMTVVVKMRRAAA
jgi:DNA replication protein DnaC